MADEAENLKKLQWGVQNGELADVEDVLTKEKCLLNKVLNNGRCAIHIAADYGQKDMVDYLINNGASVNDPDKNGITPLLAAVFENHVSTVALLLKKGAEKNGTYMEKTYMDWAETDDLKTLLKK